MMSGSAPGPRAAEAGGWAQALAFLAAFHLPDLRKRIFVVLGMFGLYVITAHVPIPHISRAELERIFQGGAGQLLGLLDVFAGGALRRFSIIALGVMPYITASILFQVLGYFVPPLQQLRREGEYGRRKLSQYTRWTALGLAFFQAMFMLNTLLAGVVETGGGGLLHGILSPTTLYVAITLTAGVAFLMWMGEVITDKGIGNGISLIIFAGIILRLPDMMHEVYTFWQAGAYPTINVLVYFAAFLLTIALIVSVSQAHRRIPVQHARRQVGRQIVSSASTFLPIRVNTAGVMPIIFAMSLLYFPAQIVTALQASLSSDVSLQLGKYLNWLMPTTVPGSLIYFLLVVSFTFFYTAIVFNVEEVSDNLKKQNSVVPGYRPGKQTTEYLGRVLERVTLAGGLFLALIALTQYWVPHWTKVTTQYSALIGGTSILIVVGVALDTMQQIEAHLVMRHYEGFLK